MWKVLIADDEPKIRRGIHSVLERLDPDIEVVAEAGDGETALALAEETVPDILFIDIRMPFLNGLELIEKLHVLRQDWIIIIVSGHDEFDYARKALSLQVFEYILKPVNEDELRSTLEHAKHELALRRETNRYINWAREKISEHQGVLKEQFILEWLSSSLSNTEIEDCTKFLGLSLPETPIILAIRLEEKALSVGNLQKGYRTILTYSVKSILEDLLGKNTLCVITRDDTIVGLYTEELRVLQEKIPAIEAAIEEATHQHPVIAFVPSGAMGGSAVRSVQEAYEEALSELIKKSNYQTFVLLAQGYIERNYQYPDLSLEETAMELEISPGYLSRLLKQATGYSFVEYVSRVRIQHALQLLADPAVKIYEIAEKVGYRSQHYFSRAFKQVLGISPVEYRKGGMSQ
ncbi:response regulator [Gracilinema caldarium]|uniref:response regulator transcription factor n=1 Tax=Gracilinema caldarium TaxID=215591 RepID=UPI0026EBEFAC|nr:response regulator [Gracilinema caldarium]